MSSCRLETMTPSDVLRDAWAAIGTELVDAGGVYQRRVFVGSPFRLYACVIHPGGRLRICVEVSSRIGTEGIDRETSGFKVHRQHDLPSQSLRISMDLNQSAFRQ